MVVICRSCNHEITDNYCPHCGQKKTVKRITWSSIVEEFFHLFTHIEKGFLRTSWQMLKNPGGLIKSYLNGQRKNIQSPISYLVIWASIFSLYGITIYPLFRFKFAELNNVYIDPKAAELYGIYPTALTILFIPIWAIEEWFIAVRKKLNYWEVLIAVFYGYGQFFAYLTITSLIFNVILHIANQTILFYYTFLLISGVDAFWKHFSLFKVYKIKYNVLKVISVVSIGSFTFIRFLEISINIISRLHSH